MLPRVASRLTKTYSFVLRWPLKGYEQLNGFNGLGMRNFFLIFLGVQTFCSYGIECVANPVDCDHNKSCLCHNIPGRNGLFNCPSRQVN